MLTTEEVKHIALLARIGLSDTETGKYRKELSSVLDFFHELEELDLSGEREGLDMPVKENDTREDRVHGSGPVSREAILQNVPSRKDGFVKVKSVFSL